VRRFRELVPDRAAGERGFSLVEALVALALLNGALLSASALFAFSARANAEAQRITMATILARDQIERLLASGPLALSPPDALTRSYRDFADVVDRSGQSVGDGDEMPAAAVYVRRWSIRPSGANPDDPLVIQVLVGARTIAAAVDPLRSLGTVRLVTLKRQPP